MRVLVACEESQEVCKAFRALGHEAYSCDLQECSGGHPEWHIQDDVLNHLTEGWDMMIGFPACTYLTYAGERWFKTDQARQAKREAAIEFFKTLYNAPIDKIALENPRGVMSKWKRESQQIQPFYFGDPYRKRTLLWLKNLPPLIFTSLNPKGIVPEKYLIRKGPFRTGGRRGVYFMDKCTGSDRAKLRSKTFPGIARAMAEQWGRHIDCDCEKPFGNPKHISNYCQVHNDIPFVKGTITGQPGM
jgi:hypothetical protein